MSLISLIVALIIVGLLLYLEETFLPIAQPIKIIIRVIVILVVILWLLQIVGFDVAVPRVR